MSQGNGNNQKPNKTYIGKVKQMQGSNGAFYKAMLDNPKPTKPDGSADEYHKGSLVWVDAKTGNRYLVKQVGFGGVGDTARNNGYVFSLYIDYDDEYQVDKIG